MPYYHFHHIVAFFWHKYNRPQNSDMRKYYWAKYDYYCYLANDEEAP